MHAKSDRKGVVLRVSAAAEDSHRGGEGEAEHRLMK